MALNIGELQIQISANTDALKSIQADIKKSLSSIERLVKSVEDLKRTMDGNNRSVNYLSDSLDRNTSATKANISKQQKLKSSVDKVEKTTKKTRKEIKGFNIHMSEMAKTATVALGPLNGVASRITALTAIASSSAIPMAILLGGLASFAVITGKSIVAGAKFESAMLQMEGAVQALGNESGLTAVKLNAMAIGLAEATLTSTALAREAAIALQAFAGIGDSTERVLYLAQDLTQVFGGSLLENTKRLGMVMEDPVKGLERLGRTGIRFTDIEKKKIKILTVSGKAHEAAALILDKVNKKVGGQGVKAAEGLAGAWDTLGERTTAFIERIGSVEVAGGGLAATIKEISDTLERWTNDTKLASNIGEKAGGILRGLGSVVLAVAKNIEILTSATIAYAVYGIAKKLIPALWASVSGLLATAKAAIGAEGGFARAAAGAKAFRAALVSTGFGALVVLVGSLVAEYVLFSDKAGDAEEAQNRLNSSLKVGEEAARNFKAEFGNIFPQHGAATVASYNAQIELLNNSINTYTERLVELNSERGRNKSKQDRREITDLTIKLQNAKRQLEDTKKALQDYRTELTELAKTKKIAEDQEQAIKLMLNAYEKLSSTYIKGKKEYDDYQTALANVEGLKENAKELGDLTEEQLNYIRVIESLKEYNGFIDLKKQIEDSKFALSAAKAELNALKESGLAAGKAIESSFKDKDIYRKFAIDVSTWSVKQRETAASVLKTGSSVESLARAFADMTIETNRANVASEALKTTLAETTAIINQAKVSEGISIADRIIDPEGMRRLTEFRTLWLDIQQKLENQVATEGGASVLTTQIEKWKEAAKAVGRSDIFAGIDPTNIEQVAQAIARLMQAQSEMSQHEDAVSNFVGALREEAKQAGLTEKALMLYNLEKEFNKNLTKEQQIEMQGELEILKQLAIQYSENAKQAKRAKEAGEQMGQAIANSLENAIVEGGNFSDILKGLEKDILRIFTKKFISQPIADALGGALGGGMQGGPNILGNITSGLGSLFSFAGGGYTGSGPRVGGIDGQGGFLSVVHPRETITDHTKQNSTPGGRQIIVNFNVQTQDANSFRQSKRQIASDLRQVVTTAGA